VNPLVYLNRTALALCCGVFTGWSAPIVYPNQAYVFSDGTASLVPGTFNVKAVAVEDDMILAVTRDGRVVASGPPEHWLATAALEQLTNVVAVGLNYTMAVALTGDGTVIEFGRTPSEQPPGLTNVIAIDVAGQAYDDDLDYKLAVTSDGRVVTWGYFGYPPSATIPGVMTAAGGWSHIVALKSDGTVVQWGVESNEPEVVAGLSNAVAVAAGGEHSVALKADGTVVAWGDNQYGQLNIPAGLSNVVAITAAEDHTLALKSDGTLAAWGRAYFGGSVTPPASLSNVVTIASSGTRNVVISALPVPPLITYPNQAYSFSAGSFSPVPGAFNVKAVAVEDDLVLAVTRDGHVVTSGVPEHWVPHDVLEQLTNVISVGLNYTMGAALAADGRVFEFDRLGEWGLSELTNVIAIDVAGQAYDDDLDYKLAVTSDGQVVTWGYFGFPPSASIPGVVTAAGGWSHIVALKGDGTVVQWGVENEPEVVGGLSNVVAVAAGALHSVALKADGTVAAWGENQFGQLNVPADLSNVVAIAAAEHHSLALKRDGTLAAWGQDSFGGSVTPPAGLSNVIAIASSGTKNLALVSIPPQRPTLAIAANALSLDQLTLSLAGETNKVYTIETSAELLTWYFLQYVTNETGTTSFEVGKTNASGQFFRAK
jgi:alpha-tubulin suppressor-like RCC1 family protein